ncbi:MAG TPA: CPBP family intramembrane glutamic endopeptidase [Candidatus Binatia bacterium]|jgi:hypothetical protein|nr:CPBP family intramembrane glutamic endopeptidase [Candidatus Binatia bacterium]
MMKKASSFFAGLELGWLFLLWIATVWGAWQYSGASMWTVSGIAGIAVTALVSTLIRRPGWKDSGFRLDNFWPALFRAGLISFCVLLLFAAVIKMAGLSFSSLPAKRMAETLLSGVAQQAYFLGYLLHRWNAFLGNPLGAVFANAVSFAFIHLPDPSLVMLTGFGGLFLNALFLRLRNVLVLGLAHGVFAVFMLSALHDAGVIGSTRIGPATLAPFSQIIGRELKSGERVGICSNGFGSRHLGSRFEYPIELIHQEHMDERERLRLFLVSDGRIFCVITEDDFYRYVDLDLQKHLVVLGSRYVWRHKIKLDRELVARLLHGNGDVPVAAVFRERVLLVSNKPSS